MLATDNKAQAVRDQDVNISRQLEVKSDFFQSLDLILNTFRRLRAPNGANLDLGEPTGDHLLLLAK